jgi:putative transposase
VVSWALSGELCAGLSAGPVRPWYRRSRAKDQSALRLRIRDLAHARPRFGYLRIWILLRREGWVVNRKRVRRLYRLEGVQLRMRVRRRNHIALHRGPAPIPAGPAERWSMDFVHDTLTDGRPFRILTVVDNWSRQSSVLEAGFRMTGETVGHVLDRSWVRAPARGPSRSIMGPNSNPARSRLGLPPGVQLDFSGRANPWKTPSLSRLTGACATSV